MNKFSISLLLKDLNHLVNRIHYLITNLLLDIS